MTIHMTIFVRMGHFSLPHGNSSIPVTAEYDDPEITARDGELLFNPAKRKWEYGFDDEDRDIKRRRNLYNRTNVTLRGADVSATGSLVTTSERGSEIPERSRYWEAVHPDLPIPELNRKYARQKEIIRSLIAILRKPPYFFTSIQSPKVQHPEYPTDVVFSQFITIYHVLLLKMRTAPSFYRGAICLVTWLRVTATFLDSLHHAPLGLIGTLLYPNRAQPTGETINGTH